MAVSKLVQLSEDKITRQAYQRRQDEIILFNKRINDYKRTIEQANSRAEQANSRAKQAEAEVEKLRLRLAELEAQYNGRVKLDTKN